MRRILSTTFISCSHDEIRFLQPKKQESKTTEESILGIEFHRFQNQESESDSIPKISESYSPIVFGAHIQSKRKLKWT